MIYDRQWKPVSEAKRDARHFIKTHKSVFIPSIFRSIMTTSLMVTVYLLMHSLAFDYAFKDYGANTTNITDYLLTIVCILFGRMLADYYLDRLIYEQTIIPFWHYLVRGIRLFIYVLISMIGLSLSVVLSKSLIIGRMWVIFAAIVYICQRIAHFGLTHETLQTLDLKKAYRESRPRTSNDIKRLTLYTLKFLVHDIINLISIGLYGIWSIPYKRATEKYMLL